MKNQYRFFVLNQLLPVLLTATGLCSNNYPVNKRKSGQLCKRSLQAFFLTTTLWLLTAATTSAQTLGQYQFNSAVGVTCLTQNKSVTTQPANAVFSAYSNVGGTCAASTTAFVNSS